DAISTLGMKHLMRDMQPLAVPAEQQGGDANTLAEQHFAIVDGVGLGGEGTAMFRLLIGALDAERVEQRRRAAVEDLDVKGQVHVAVGVDPVRTHDRFVFAEGRREWQIGLARHVPRPADRSLAKGAAQLSFGFGTAVINRPAFFQALKPPSRWQTGVSPMRCSANVASAERQPLAQKNTNFLPEEKIGL